MLAPLLSGHVLVVTMAAMVPVAMWMVVKTAVAVVVIIVVIVMVVRCRHGSNNRWT